MNKYYETESRDRPLSGPLLTSIHTTNDFLKSTSFEQADWTTHQYPYASTYNCLRGGGEVIDIYGKHLGSLGTSVSVGGVLCENVKVKVEEYHLQCTVPPHISFGPEDGEDSSRDVDVTVQLGDVPLSHHVRYLSYQEPPPQMLTPTLSNVASSSIDVSWICPGDLWTQLTVR